MNSSRRELLAAAVAGGALFTLGGCEKLVSKATEQLGQTVPDSISPSESAEIDPAHHLLNRAAFGPWPGDVERVRAMGPEAWIDEQLNPDAIDDSLCYLRASRCEGMDGPAGEAFEYKKTQLRRNMAQFSLLHALYSKRQLFEVMVSFWTDHLNINIDKGDCIYLKPWDDRNVIRKHALGNFRDLIRASATSPAMLVYLDGNHNKRSTPDDIPNENYGRELLELHTLGVHGGYTQRDVFEAARAMTGWRVRTGLRKGSVHFVAKEHDQESKVLLGKTIPAAQNEKDVEDVIDIVCRHPSTPMHIATKLVRRFVSEDPPEALVRRVAEVFRRSGGDIKRMVRTVLTSSEFKSARGTKFKPPFRFVISALRALGADTHAHQELIDYLTRMGQGVFQYPTPDGYPDKTSPWLGTLLWRWNLAFALAANTAPSVHVPLEKLLHALGAMGSEMPVKLFEHLAGHAPTPTQVEALTESLETKSLDAKSAQGIVGLILSSPSFQKY